MADIFQKLNWKSPSVALVLNAPDSFRLAMAALPTNTIAEKASRKGSIPFLLAFVMKQIEVDHIAERMLRQCEGDAVVWFAYPKQTSRRYRCEFHRDNGWASVGAQGFEPVRMVAIDEDWSALRFRRTEFIKKLTRSKLHALSPEGKVRTRISS
jgi:hypothetical protein